MQKPFVTPHAPGLIETSIKEKTCHLWDADGLALARHARPAPLDIEEVEAMPLSFNPAMDERGRSSRAR